MDSRPLRRTEEGKKEQKMMSLESIRSAESVFFCIWLVVRCLELM